MIGAVDLDLHPTYCMVTKPAQYAAAGIRAYWRVETEPAITLTAHHLQSGSAAHTEVGTWRAGETVRLDSPFTVQIAVDDLTP